MKSVSFRDILKWTWFPILVIIIIAAIYFNRTWLTDFYRGITYEPSYEILQIRASLQLTDYGKFLFNSARPELNESEDFNSHCRDVVNEDAILGCYTEQNIYVYNITAKELDGIREVTTAHELLHAYYERLSDEDKASLKSDLSKAYEDNKEILEEELAIYQSTERDEELYVRAGTEIANLPGKLESHYARLFQDQDYIAKFYENYVTVFRENRATIERLSKELEELNTTIDNKVSDYESRTESLDSAIQEFNNCADTPNCFTSASEFNSRRQALLAEQSALQALYDELSTLVAQYNTKVKEYNSSVLYNEKLNTIINSAKPNTNSL